MTKITDKTFSDINPEELLNNKEELQIDENSDTNEYMINKNKLMIINCQKIINKYEFDEDIKKILLEAYINMLNTKINLNINIERSNIENTINNIKEIFINNNEYKEKLIEIITINTDKLIQIRNEINGIKNDEQFMNNFIPKNKKLCS